MRATTLVGLFTLALSSCYDPSIPSGTQKCAAGNLCPDGYQCGADGLCYKNGELPRDGGQKDAPAAPDLAGRDLAGADLASSDQAVGDLAQGAADMVHACSSDAGCGGATPRCDLTVHLCVACLPTNDNCPNGSFCTQTNGAWGCVQGCKTSTDCTGTANTCCGNVCVDTTSDSANCSGCGIGCAGTKRCCSSVCDDLTSDVNNCGMCGQACNLANANPTCTASACAVSSCKAPFGDCDKMASNGCELNLSNNASNCGGCGVVCSLPHATASCVNSTCGIASCNAGFANCNGNAADGCETSTSGDVNNCGMCGKVCSLPNATAGCSGGACTVAACNAGWSNCDGVASNGCESVLATDALNCGQCGKLCGGTLACINSACSANRRAFVSSTLYTGNLGGVAGADASCNALAASVGIRGTTFKAWLSDDLGNNPVARNSKPASNYVLVDGVTVVAAGWNGLISGTLQHAINLTEKRTAAPVGTTNCAGGGHATVWTDTFNTGAQFLPGMNYHCSNWTDGGGATGSEWGDGNDPTQWSAWCNGGICSWTSSIYCIEQ